MIEKRRILRKINPALTRKSELRVAAYYHAQWTDSSDYVREDIALKHVNSNIDKVTKQLMKHSRV